VLGEGGQVEGSGGPDDGQVNAGEPVAGSEGRGGREGGRGRGGSGEREGEGKELVMEDARDGSRRGKAGRGGGREGRNVLLGFVVGEDVGGALSRIAVPKEMHTWKGREFISMSNRG